MQSSFYVELNFVTDISHPFFREIVFFRYNFIGGLRTRQCAVDGDPRLHLPKVGPRRSDPEGRAPKVGHRCSGIVEKLLGSLFSRLLDWRERKCTPPASRFAK